jgi:hypothetical protein
MDDLELWLWSDTDLGVLTMALLARIVSAGGWGVS